MTCRKEAAEESLAYPGVLESCFEARVSELVREVLIQVIGFILSGVRDLGRLTQEKLGRAITQLACHAHEPPLRTCTISVLADRALAAPGGLRARPLRSQSASRLSARSIICLGSFLVFLLMA